MAILVNNPAEDYLKRYQTTAPATGMTTEAPKQTTMVRATNGLNQVDEDPKGTGTMIRTQPAQGVETTPPSSTVFHSTAGDNALDYVNRTSANLGKDPGAISEAGKLYADRVTNGLKTPDASSVNAQNTEDTAAARRAYLAKVSAEERAAQSGFAPGSAQATRIFDQSQAGVNAANQAGQSAVNAYIRQRTEDNMTRAQGLETQQYNRNRDVLRDAQDQDLAYYGRSEKATDRGLEAARVAYGKERDQVADSQWNTINTQNQEQRKFENQQVLKGDDDQAKRDLLNRLPEGPAKNQAMRLLAAGETPSDVLETIMSPDGSIKESYRGKTPGELGLEGEREYAIQTLELEAQAKGTAFDPNSPEGIKAIAAKMSEQRKVKNNPVTKETEAAEAERIRGKLSTGESLSKEEKDTAIKVGIIPPLTASTVPITGGAVSQFLKDNPHGQFAVNGNVFKILDKGSFNNGHETEFVGTNLKDDFVVLENVDTGKVYYYSDATDVKPEDRWFSERPTGRKSKKGEAAF